MRGAGGAGGAETTVVLATGAIGGGTGVVAAFACTCGWRAASSSSFFLARMALSTSPGLEICERSIFGAIVCCVRPAASLAWPAERVPRSKCARTLSASSDSRELEWVLPAPRPSSANTSRICLLLTSISRARSLIRTLLIRLFSKIPFPRLSVAHGYLETMAASQMSVFVQRALQTSAHLTRRPLWPPALRSRFRFLLRPQLQQHWARFQLLVQWS